MLLLPLYIIELCSRFTMSVTKLQAYSPESDTVGEYIRWKRARRDLIFEVGMHLFSLDESAILAFLDRSEKKARDSLLPESSDSTILIGLLDLSIVMYFHRTLARVMDLVPTICQLVQSRNRCICCVATRIVAQFCRCSVDNINFFHDVLRSTQAWASGDGGDPSVFSALCVLRKSLRFAPALVRSIVVPRFDTLFQLALSEDPVIQDYAVAVLRSHMGSNRPGHGSHIIQECVSMLVPRQSSGLRGALLMLDAAIEDQILNISKYLNEIGERLLCLNGCNNTQTMCLAYSVLVKVLSKDSFEYKVGSMTILVENVWYSVRMFPDSPDLLKAIQNVLELIPSKFFPAENVVKLAQNIFGDSKSPDDFGYWLLKLVINRVPNYVIQIQVPFDHSLSKSYRKLIRRRPMLISSMQKSLVEMVMQGLKTYTTEQALINTLKLIRVCRRFSAEQMELIKEKTMSLISSNSEAVRLEATKVLAKVEASKKHLLYSAVFDESEAIRIASVKRLATISCVGHEDTISMILADESIQVRSMAIDLFSVYYRQNPIAIATSFYRFARTLMRQYARAENLKEAQDLSGLFPKMAELCKRVHPELTLMIGNYCLYFLTRGTIPKPLVLDEASAMVDPFKNHRETLKSYIFYLYFSPCLDVCDVNFIRTVQVVKDSVDVTQVVKMVKMQLSEKRTEEVQIALVELVSAMVGMIKNEQMNEIARFIFDIFVESKSSEVSVKILRLFGNTGITKIPRPKKEENEEVELPSGAVSMNRFVSEGIFNALCNLIPDPPPLFFKAATSVIVLNSQRAPAFLGKIIPEFIRALSVSKGDFERQLIRQLMKILVEVKNSFTPYLKLLAPILQERLGEVQCVKFCILLSRTLHDNMIPVVSPLYHKAVAMMTREETEVTKYLLRFLASSVIFQHQSLHVFISVCEQHHMSMTHFVNKELIRVLQNCPDAVRFCAWIFRIVLRKISDSKQVVYTLVRYGGLSLGLIKTALGDKNDDPNLNTLRQYVSGDKTVDLSFILKIPGMRSRRSGAPRQEIPVANVFANFAPPVNNNVDTWFQDFVYLTVSMSPNRSIRNCVGLVNQSEQFRQDILKPAFVTCWAAATAKEKQTFLNIFTYVLETFNALPACLFELIDSLDVQKCAFPIPQNILASAASDSPALAHLYWTRHFGNTHKDADQYLRHCLQMGRVDTAKGILASVGKDVISDIDYWNEKLGNWKKTLKLCREDDYVTQIKCYGHMEEWHKIGQLFKYFPEMTQPEQEDTSLWFAWSFYYSNRMDMVQQMIKRFPDNELRQHTFLRLLVLVAGNQFEKAERIISDEFIRMTANKSPFNESNSALAEEQLIYAQHLIEFEEVIDMKRSKRSQPPEMWKYRGSFVDRIRDCRQLTNIRSLVLSQKEKVKLHLKMAEALRKGREIKSFTGIYRRLLALCDTPRVRLEGVKMLWAQNKKRAAIAYLSIVVNHFLKYDADFVRRQLELLSVNELKMAAFVEPADDKELLIERFLKKSKEYLDTVYHGPKETARLVRLLTEWTMQEIPQTRESILENTKRLETAMTWKPNDVKILFDYALFTDKALDLAPDNQLALNAIRSFVKVIKMSPPEKASISPFLLLLNIISRCANDEILEDPIFGEIRHFPSSIIASAMPQFENLISHRCEKLRMFVRSIFLGYGKECFQSLFYTLNIAMQGDDPISAGIATEVYEKLVQRDPDLADEMQLFVQGLRKAAISTLEQWKSGIENARKEFEGGNEPGMVSILTNLLYIHDHPSCELDRTFKKIIEMTIEKFRDSFKRFCQGDRKFLPTMWGNLHAVFEVITRRLGQLAVINLHNVCEPLASKKHFNVFVPGNPNNIPIESVCPVMKVFSTAFHPRFMSLVGRDGKNYNFLLKGNCDIRIDFRIMQFFKLANTLLCRNRLTSELSITEYSIIPFTSDAGVISWVENADSLHQIINEFKEDRIIEGRTIEMHCGANQAYMNCLQLYELHLELISKTKAMEIARYLWLKTRQASLWLRNSDTYVKSLALMSICGYIIGLGDRHPSNIMIQRHSGKIAHIDFGDSFEVTMNRTTYPERVPFRLTRMLRNALDGCTPHGIFERKCQCVMSVMKTNKQAVMAQLELCTRDTTLTNLAFDKLPILERVRAKLDGNDPLEDGQTEPLDTDEQVSRLIEIASDPIRYSMQFIGWCPHW